MSSSRLRGVTAAIFVTMAIAFGFVFQGKAAISWSHALNTGSLGTGLGDFQIWYSSRTGMPPASSFLEILLLNLDRSFGLHLLDLFLRWGYHLLAATYWWLILSKVSHRLEGLRAQLIAVGIAVVLYFGSTQIYFGNPQIYDLQYGLVVLWITSEVLRDEGSPLRVGLPLFLLAYLRPFGFPLLCALIPALALKVFRRDEKSRRLIVAAMGVALAFALLRIPHVIRTGQFVWSNHVGFNLMHVWWPVVKGSPDLESEETWLDARGIQRQNLETAIHFRNSERLKSAIWSGATVHPWEAAQILAERLSVVVRFPVGIYHYTPEGVAVQAVAWVWRLGFFGLVGFLLIQIFQGTVFGQSRPSLALLSGWFLVIVFLTVVGDDGEESRLLSPLLGPILVVVVEVIAASLRFRSSKG